MKHFLSTVVLLLLAFGGTAFAENACLETTHGKCFAFHGRFAVYSGDGMETLWPVGTRRLLYPEFGAEALEQRLSSSEDADTYFIFGNFVVCPLEEQVAGKMRHVCVQSVRNLRVRKRDDSHQ
jgi:hypothetical protein